jgi:phenylalanyl-tRNA synthetase beta subunit
MYWIVLQCVRGLSDLVVWGCIDVDLVLSFTVDYMNTRLGARITVEEIETILNNYGYL